MKIRGYACIKQETNIATGLPDRLLLFPGGVVCFVELKSAGDNPSPRQELMHTKLRNLGFLVFIIRTKEEVDFIIKLFSPIG